MVIETPAGSRAERSGRVLGAACNTAPALSLTAHPDPDGGWNLEIGVANLTIEPAHDGGARVVGEGQLRLLVNAVPLTRLYDGWFHLPPMLRGSYSLTVAAIANDGRTLTLHRVPISATTQVNQADHAPHSDEPAPAPEVVAGAGAPSLSLAVVPAIDGGYLVHVRRENFVLAPLAAGRAHVPGEGHLELGIDGIKVARLYADSFYLPPLAAGPHHITVAAVTNDHRPYATPEGPVMALSEVTSAEGRPLILETEPADPHEHH